MQYLGQPVFAVIAETRDQARRAAAQAKATLTFAPLPPILTPVEAHAAKSYVLPPMHLARGDARAAIAAAPHRLADTLEVGGQEQFYLEGQISYAVPREDSGMLVHCSTQHPSEMQHLVAKCLGLQSHHVAGRVPADGRRLRRQGVAVGAVRLRRRGRRTRLGRPVKLRLDRDDDFLITGRRHCFHYEYEVGFDDDGRVLGAELTMVSRAGFSADLSGPVMTRAICHFDNAYWLPDVAIHGYSRKDEHQSNTAFRGFGGPQGAIAIENIVDSIARKLGKDPLDVRRVNFYGASARPGAPGDRNVTPYGQTLDDNIVVELVAELEATSRYRARRAEIAAYNATQRGAEARPRADAGQVRHLVQPGPSQPGRRTGPRLRRRLGAGQPRRHRDGPGAQHQGRPGRRPRARHRLRRGARHRDRHRRRSPTPRRRRHRPAAT